MKSSCFLLIATLFFASCSNSGNDKKQEKAPSEPDAVSQVEQGKELFAINCANCHMVKQDLTGPALAGVDKRWNDKALLHRYIRNSQEVIKEDKYAMDLFLKWNKSIMNPFPAMDDAKIDAILAYINEAGK